MPRFANRGNHLPRSYDLASPHPNTAKMAIGMFPCAANNLHLPATAAIIADLFNPTGSPGANIGTVRRRQVNAVMKLPPPCAWSIAPAKSTADSFKVFNWEGCFAPSTDHRTIGAQLHIQIGVGIRPRTTTQQHRQQQQCKAKRLMEPTHRGGAARGKNLHGLVNQRKCALTRFYTKKAADTALLAGRVLRIAVRIL